jgi:hypothetical protein
MPAPLGTSQSTPYAAITYAPIGGVCAATGVASVGDHGVDDPEFCQLRDLLADSGHTRVPSRWPNTYGRIGAGSVMAYIQYLDSECRRLDARVCSLEDVHDLMREQLYEERQQRVTWLSGALHDASQRMNEPVRKRRRDNE